MKRFFGFLTVAAFAGMLFAANVFAQSSGSFNYSGASQSPVACVLNNDNTGTISGGVPCALTTGGSPCGTALAACPAGQFCFNPNNTASSGVCELSTSGAACGGTTGVTCTAPETCVFPSGSSTGTCGVVCSGSSCGTSRSCIGSVSTTIKTSSGAGNVFDIRPSAVIGLLTDVSVSSKQEGGAATVSSSALAGVDFKVSVSPASTKEGPVALFPLATQAVTYDSRFIQISTNLFQGLVANCTSSAGGCFITFNESTVSAHSFDWVASNLFSGDYKLTASWTSSLGDFGIGNSATCVGPVNLTVEQNKVFSPSTGISF